MQIICSLLNLQTEKIKNKTMQNVIDTCCERVNSMALVHENLYQSKDFTQIDFKAYIKKLTENLFDAYVSDSKTIDIKLNIQNIFISLDQAVPYGLVINELISNALKYAFPPSFKGKSNIEIAMKTTNGHIDLVIKDNGVGIPDNIKFKQTESLGLKLTHLLVEEQLHGIIHLDRTKGTKFIIHIPSKPR